MGEIKASPPSRSIWTGRISIGLVNVPVKLYTLVRDSSAHFKLVRKKDGSPVSYLKVANDGTEVNWSEIGKGYDVGGGRLVIFDEEELKAMRPESSKKIAIDRFVPHGEINPIYIEKSYLLAPDKASDAYGLLLSALQEMDMAGIGTLTIRTKEHPVAVYPYGDSIVLSTMHYAYEIVDPADVVRDIEQPGDEELDLAMKIMQNLSGSLNIAEYKDNFSISVEKAAQKKIRGEEVFHIESEPKAEEVHELMNALKQTLEAVDRQRQMSGRSLVV